MSTHRFTWGEDVLGESGWLMDGHPNFWAAEPRNLAHDCLEHFPKGETHGPAADELLALGARFYLRGASGWWAQQRNRDPRSPIEIMATELVFLHRELGGDVPPLANRLLGEHDEDIDQMVSLAIDVITGNLGDEELEPTFGPNCAAWLRAGYRAAIKRYKETDPLNIMWLAEQLEKELEQYAKAEDGEQLVVRIHEKDQEFKITFKPHFWNEK